MSQIPSTTTKSLFARSDNSYSHSTQREIWLWYVHHKDDRGVGWKYLSREICAHSSAAWHDSYYVEIENWGRGRGKISSEDTFDMLYRYREHIEEKTRRHVSQNMTSEFLVSIIENHLTDKTKWNLATSPENSAAINDVVGSQNLFEGFWAKEKTSGYEKVFNNPPAFKAGMGYDNTLLEVLYLKRLPASRLYRLTRAIVYEGRVWGVPECGILSPYSNQSGTLWVWDQEEYNPRLGNVGLLGDGTENLRIDATTPARDEFTTGYGIYRRCVHSEVGKVGLVRGKQYYKVDFNHLKALVDGIGWSIVP